MQVLDLVADDEQLRLIDLLAGQPAAFPALADHFGVCKRLADADRAARLISLAEGGDDDVLEHALEQFGVHDFGVGVPTALRARFAALMARVAESGSLTRGGSGDLSQAFSLVVGWGDGRWLDVFAARRAAMLQDGPDRWWDLLHETGGDARARTLRLLGPLFLRGGLEPVLDGILQLPPATVDDDEVVRAIGLPPSSWVGDLSNEYEARAGLFAQRAKRGTRRARAFARKAEAYFRDLARSERARTRQRSEGYRDD